MGEGGIDRAGRRPAARAGDLSRRRSAPPAATPRRPPATPPRHRRRVPPARHAPRRKPSPSRRVTGSNPRGLLLTERRAGLRGDRRPRPAHAALGQEAHEPLPARAGAARRGVRRARRLPDVQRRRHPGLPGGADPPDRADRVPRRGRRVPALVRRPRSQRRPDPRVLGHAPRSSVEGRARRVPRRARPTAAAKGETTTTEPFRRWARELSRYSFETGQEVFSKGR